MTIYEEAIRQLTLTTHELLTIGEQVIQAHGDDPPDPDWSGSGEGSGVFVRWIPRFERSPDRLWAVLEWRAHAIPVADIAALLGVPEARVWSWLRRNTVEARKEREAVAVRRQVSGGEHS
ncbi:hypothetical protein BS329_15900 [Amycolatopsis coloradensis]|uniref:Uncharacterized protein n=1 Tax=Amycolatopsis coloradensis TaxID=76021 RepID=A0A1R0KUC4_9PSEU|nr:hypothetical protein [Amycolatopsis coloradensis]OLZ51743.1 hypothetical protein BS329_15900 [Amycolatopsis coloradensis]